MAPQLEPRHLDLLKSSVRVILGDTPCSVVLFGSRARGAARAGSDIDLAVFSDTDVGSRISRLREALEESTLPFCVDVVDMRAAGPGLAKAVRSEGIPVWQS